MTLWNEVLVQIKSNLSKPSYDTWLKNTKLLPFDKNDDKLVIEMPNEFSKDWVQGRYTILISDTIYNITGEQYKLEFVTSTERDSRDEVQQLPSIQSETQSTIENKLDLILSELKEMNRRVSKLEIEFQEIKYQRKNQ